MGFNFKTKSSSPVRGGGAKMFGKQHSGTQKPFKTSTENGKGGGKGGKGKMVGKQTVKASKAR